MLFLNKFLEYLKHVSLVESIQRWEPILSRYSLVAVIIYPFLMIWQGGDYTDTGYHALNSQRFFADLELGEIYAPAFLTYFIGGLWWKYFSWLGLIGLKFLSCIFIAGSAVGIIYLLKHYNPKILIYLSVLAAEAYSRRFSPIVLSYDIVSLFFLIWAAVIFLTGIEKRKIALVALAGALIACATLARIPSVMGGLLVVIPFFDFLVNSNGLFNKFEYRRLLNYPVKYGLIFCSGFFGTLGVFAFSLYSADLLDLYVTDIIRLFSTLEQKQGYGKSVLLSKYLLDLKQTVLWGGVAVLWVIAAGNILATNTRDRIKFIFLFITGTMLLLWVLKDPTYTSNLKHLVLSIYSGMSLCIILGVVDTPNLLRNATVAGLILCIVTFIGSNTGLLKTAGGMLLLIPVCTISFYKQQITQLSGIRMPVRSISIAITSLLLVAVMATQFSFVYNVSSGLTARLHMRYRFDSPLLRGINTTKDRSKFINQILPEIEQQREGGKIYVYGHMPILYFLTQTRPFISKIWLLGNKYTAETIFETLHEETRESSLPPLIVITDRMQLGERGWELMTEFLEKYQYTRVFSTTEGAFEGEIWQSEQ
jgi:hypothetical protein